MSPLQFCLPVFLGIHRNPKKIIPARDFWNKSHLSTFIHLDKHLDGAWDKFWIKSQNGTFISLQMKAFGPKKFKLHTRVKINLKSAILAFFTHAWNLNFWGAKCLHLKCFESAILWFYPKFVSGSVQVLIQVDKSG